MISGGSKEPMNREPFRGGPGSPTERRTVWGSHLGPAESSPLTVIFSILFARGQQAVDVVINTYTPRGRKKEPINFLLCSSSLILDRNR